MTKHLHDHVNDDALKCSLCLDDIKVEVLPKIIDNTMILGTTNVIGKPKEKMKNRMVKAKMTVKKSRLEKATNHLYDLENSYGPEKTLNIDLGLYQMEDY